MMHDHDAELTDVTFGPRANLRGGQMSDTSAEAAEILRQRTLSLTPAQRFEEGAKLCKLARAFMRAGIRQRHPEYDDAHVEMALARLLWGDELYRKARPDWPRLDP
jgi:hypothetical protein